MVTEAEVLLNKYLKHLLGIRGVRNSSCATYKSKLNKFLRKVNKEPDLITESDIGKFMISLKEEGQSINSQRMFITAIKGFYAWHQKVNKGKNPSKNLLPLREFKKHPHIMTVEEVERMIVACEGGNFQQIRNAAMLCVLADTGIRISELLALKVGNIQENETQFIMTVPATKSSCNRMVPFCFKQEGSLIAEMFGKYWICVKHMNRWGMDEYLFQRETVYWKKAGTVDGWVRGAEKALGPGPLTISSVAKMIKRVRIAAKVDKNVTPHMFRHFYATYLALLNVNILIIQQRLGHASLDRTKIYLSYAEIVKNDSAKNNPMSGVKTKEKGYIKALKEFNKR